MSEGVGTIRGCWGVRGGLGLAGSVGAKMPAWVSVASGAPRGVGGSGAIRRDWGLAGGVGWHWGGRWTGSLTTLGPSLGSQHSHWFPLGSDLPPQPRQGSLLRVPSLPLVSLGE